jgi:hypothetical protein
MLASARNTQDKIHPLNMLKKIQPDRHFLTKKTTPSENGVAFL